MKNTGRILRGGFWENFFIKYTESNHLHKKMLYVSAKVHQALPESAHREGGEAYAPRPCAPSGKDR